MKRRTEKREQVEQPSETYEEQQARLWAEMAPLEIPTYEQRDIQQRVS